MKKRMTFGTIVTLAVLCLALGANAQDYAEGWINLFDGETLFGWTQFGEGDWKVVDGVLTCERGVGGWLSTTSAFTDYVLNAKVRVAEDETSGLVFRTGQSGHPSENRSGLIPLSGGDAWQEVVVRISQRDVSVTVNGEEVAIANKEQLRGRGHIGILFHGGKVEVSEIKLRPIRLKSIFNGENLDGWEIIPDRKSIFSVVDGALNIKNGNGQIETTDVYRNFLLQMAIYSNGEHLNSGVFFRGPKGVFWKGYESQVRNQWNDDDRTKPVDYGTGGLYGIQPARKVVPSDKEWFYKTIVCDGNHFAVWVNGYLVSDFVDTRPEREDFNAKAGYVSKAGTIHLQGHDPTTDLSFKDINIQQYGGVSRRAFGPQGSGRRRN